MTDQPSPFAPFQPGPAAPTAETPPAETAKQKAAREKREAKAAAEAGAPKPEKAARKTGLKSHAPKFDLQTTLAAAKMLNEDDFALFEKLVNMLDEAGKPARDRVLAAASKVFG